MEKRSSAPKTKKYSLIVGLLVLWHLFFWNSTWRLRFFMDSRLNKNGGTLIFTTHYPELLDEYDRNDGICIVRNRNGITAENLSHILNRNDIKKSDAYQSGFL